MPDDRTKRLLADLEKFEKEQDEAFKKHQQQARSARTQMNYALFFIAGALVHLGCSKLAAMLGEAP